MTMMILAAGRKPRSGANSGGKLLRALAEPPRLASSEALRTSKQTVCEVGVEPNPCHRRRSAYFPFGGGPRLCIGVGFALMEAQLILATVAQSYRLRLAPAQLVEPQLLITLRPRHGMRMTLEPQAQEQV